MLPHRRGSSSRSQPSSGRRPVSDKEEIARAALRSLAEPSAGPTSSDPPLLPRPPLASPSYSPAHQLSPPPPPPPSHPQSSRELDRSSLYDDDRHDRGSMASGLSIRPTRDELSRSGTIAGSSGGSAAAAGMTRGASSSSFFDDRALIASPEPSPTSAAVQPQPPPLPSHTLPRHSVPSTAGRAQIHETALRRASVALGVNLDDVRQIVHDAYASRRTSHSTSSTSSSASGPGYLAAASAMNYPSGFVRQVLDAYDLESDRASQLPALPPPAYDSRIPSQSMASGSSHMADRGLASSGVAWHDMDRPSNRPPPPPQHHHPQTDRSTLVAWGHRPDTRLPTFESRLPESSSRSAQPANQVTHWYEPSAAAEPAAAVPPQRPESPSPFAYDAYRRSSNPSASELEPAHRARPAALVSRASYGSVVPSTRSHATEWTRQPPDSSIYERRVRSIDDYTEPQPIQRQYRARSGSMTQYPMRASALVEAEEERLPDRNVRSNFRHSYQPYPPQSGRYGATLSTVGMTHAPSESPQLSPTTHDPQRYQNFAQLRSPAAETATSLASPPSTSTAALTPSPLLGASGSSSARLMPDSSKRALGLESDTLSPSRGASEDPAAESTRAGVANMQIDDEEASSKAEPPTAAAQKPRSSRASSSRADRTSVPIQNTDLSHSEIMQRLQDKVKGRLVAKGKGALLAETTSKAKLTSKAARGSKVGRTGSIKRSAASLSKSESADRASAPATASTRTSRDETPSKAPAVAQESASQGAASPAAKVRRTSSSNQPKPLVSQLSDPHTKSASPVLSRDKSPPKTIEQAIAQSASSRQSITKSVSPGQKSVHTPPSIEAALLSPTDTPTPSEAAANHAQRLSRSPLPPEGAVESATGQALPANLPGAGQMNAGSATKQQTAKAGADSLVQDAQSKDPTETSSAMA